MTGMETLEISRLDEAGQVIRRIRCLAGRVTVFRANSQELLEMYHKAFEGVRQKERFTMLLDSVTFNPYEHHLIGFGERFGDSYQEKVSEYLIRNGVSAAEIEALLLAHGLGGLSASPCSDLSTSQERIVRILAATASINKVLILNDPFEIIPDQWREKLAALIVNYAWKKKGIVVVTKLTYRPQEWIENEIIARIQLERPRQRTIGFGGEGFEANELIKAIRADPTVSGAVSAPKVEAVPPVVSAPSRKANLLNAPPPMSAGQRIVSQAIAMSRLEPPKQPAPFGWGFALLICFLVVSVTSLIAYFQMAYARPEPYASNAVAHSVIENAKPVELVKSNGPQKITTVLETYPANIKDAVMQAFSDPQAQLQLASDIVINKTPRKVIEQQSFTYPNQESYEPPSQNQAYAVTDDEMERRREEIRQRFLAAIQAQSETR